MRQAAAVLQTAVSAADAEQVQARIRLRREEEAKRINDQVKKAHGRSEEEGQGQGALKQTAAEEAARAAPEEARAINCCSLRRKKKS